MALAVRACATWCSAPAGTAAKVTIAPARCGIAIVANDKIFPWLLAFLESWRVTNAATPLHIIPYDENCTQTRRAAAVYGAAMVEDELAEIDALSRRLYPLNPGKRRRLRKLQSLALPLDQVIYLDADIILFRDFSPLFGKLVPGECEFIIASTSRKSMPVGLTGVTVGLTLVVIHLICIPIDNTSVNPARSLATAIFQGSWALSQLWVFIVFPIVGGILGGAIWKFLRPETDEETEEESEAVAPAPYGRREMPGQ